MYFWENNYERALSWANDKKVRGKIDKPAVIGAVINLGYFCDFLDAKHIGILKPNFSAMDKVYTRSDIPLPQNRDHSQDKHKDKLLRELDCTVIEFIHNNVYNKVQSNITLKGYSEANLFDSVRGVFIEGGPAFEGSGIFDKSHIQICIRNPNCILGFFRPRLKIDYMQWHMENYRSKSGSVQQIA